MRLLLLLTSCVFTLQSTVWAQGLQRDWTKQTSVALGRGLLLSDLNIRSAEILTRGRNGAETVRFQFESGKVTVFSAPRLKDVVNVPPKPSGPRIPLLTATFTASTAEIEFPS